MGSADFSRSLPCQIEIVAKVRGSAKIVLERSEIGEKQQKPTTQDLSEALTQLNYKLVNTVKLI